jgi:hypothetical protein
VATVADERTEDYYSFIAMCWPLMGYIIQAPKHKSISIESSACVRVLYIYRRTDLRNERLLRQEVQHRRLVSSRRILTASWNKSISTVSFYIKIHK